MLDKIIFFSIKNKLIIGLFVLILVSWGIYSVQQLPIDAVPDITNNQVQIITNSPSNGAEDIERFITFPVEQAVTTIPGIEEVRSFSRFGLSVVTVVFEDNIDIYWARQQVGERLTLAMTEIPSGMGTPYLAPVSTGLGEIYQYVIHTKEGYESKYNAVQLRTIQDWIVRRQLLGVEGVADVSSFGGYLKQYEISLDPIKIRSMNISISEIFSALERNNQNTGGAYIDKTPSAYFIRSEGLIGSVEDIENIVVKQNPNGIPILIRNVATVNEGTATRYGAMTRNNEGEVVGAIVFMLKGANSSKVIKNVKDRMDQIRKTLPEGVIVEPFLDRTKLVDNAIGTVTTNLIEGALIVIFVLIVLLGNLRAGLIVASVIPLAMLFAISMMNLFGISGNLMSLGAIDFGLIVDGAVIIVEATMHHLGLRKSQTMLTQSQMDEEVYSSASKIRNSAAFGEIIILIVYLPILALVGVEGKMFKPMAQTVSFAILGAFLLSLTYVPMVSALFLSKKPVAKRNISDRIMDFFHKVYDPVLNFTLQFPKAVVGVALGLFITVILLFNSMGAEFIPTLDEGDFAVETRLMTGSSLAKSVDVSLKASKILQENFPEVIQTIGKIGSSEIPTDPMPLEACDLMIILKDKEEWETASSREELAEKMKAKLEQFIPGVNFGFQQPIQMRFNELMTGARQDVVVKIYGEDLDKLGHYARQVGTIAKQIDGAEDVYVEEVSGLPQMVVTFNRDKIAQFGLNIEDVNTVIRTAFAGEKAGLVFEGEKRFDLVVRLSDKNRQTLDDLKGLYVTTPKGSQVSLEQLADVRFKAGPNQIQRDEAKRRIIVGFNVRGRDVESIVEEIQKKIDGEVNFEPGYFPTYGGTFENLKAAKKRLSVAVPVALLLIFLLLYFTFSSIKHALLIFTAIPLSAIGGVIALYLRGMPFSISAGVGFIALFGVAVLNGIVLVAEFNRLKKEGISSMNEILKKGTAVRLRPVIMTAMVASLGFLPMALSNGSGAEVQRPLATVVIGGLITATLLTLLVLPILYKWFDKINMKTTKIKTAVVILAFALPGLASAQEKAITLDEAIKIGLENNKTIHSANLEIRHQQLQKRASVSLPKTDVSVVYGQYNSVIKTDNNLTATQSVPFPTVLSANASLGNALIKSSELKYATTENELVQQIKTLYNHLQYLYEQQEILKQQDSIYSEFVKAATLRYKTGESNLLEKTSAEVKHHEMTNALQANQSDIKSHLIYLQALLGVNNSLNLAEKSLSEHSFNLVQDSSVIAANPSLQYVMQEIEIAERKKKLLSNQALPDITVGYFSQTLIGTQTINGQDVYYGSSDRFTGVQVGLAIPLFFGSHVAKVRAAKIDKQIAESNYELYETNLKATYQQAIQAYLKNKRSLEYYQNSALPDAELLLKSTQLSYRQGDMGYAEYLLHMNSINTIQDNYLKTLKDYNQSIINIEFLMGSN